MKKVLVSLYNTDKIGGPNVSSYNLMNSFLREKYSFSEIVINDCLGKIIRIKVLRRLIKEIKTIKPDIVVVNGLQLHGFYISLACKLSGYSKKTLLIIHGSATEAMYINAFTKFMFGKIIEPFTIRHSYVVTTVCKSMADKSLVARNAKRFGGVIHNVAPAVEIKKIPGIKVRQKLGIGEDEIVCIYTGRIHREKGLSYLFDAFSFADITSKLIIVGDGPDLKEYALQCQNNEELSKKVFFVGKTNNVFSLLKECDIFVFPSLHENLPNSILEACSVGLPVVSTNVGGIPEIVEDGAEGYLVNPASSIELHDALFKMCTDRKLIEKFGCAAKRKVQKFFSEESVYGDVDRLFEEIIGKE